MIQIAAQKNKKPPLFQGSPSIYTTVTTNTGGFLQLHYYGARYLDPKTSRWLSGDPALGEYVPVAPNGDEARKHNQNLPGMGGVFNLVNLHVYHYAGNNPVKYVDPDGEEMGMPEDIKITLQQREMLNNLNSPEQAISWMRERGHSDSDIANHLLTNYLGVDLNVTQIGNIVFNETISLSGENIQEARENIAHAIINAKLKWGDNVNTYARTAPSTTSNTARTSDSQQYNDSHTAAINAVINHSIGIDPTGGSEHFNFRRNNSTNNFFGASIKTQVGPLNNSYLTTELPAKNIYANTYKRP